mmetsp:Transcript_13174/g.52785  ORF Transcript_13174/g.52785 Transcript_13174/m.52785 type:complete len:1019 (-) Transcript_13174:549-3605(-)
MMALAEASPRGAAAESWPPPGPPEDEEAAQFCDPEFLVRCGSEDLVEMFAQLTPEQPQLLADAAALASGAGLLGVPDDDGELDGRPSWGALSDTQYPTERKPPTTARPCMGTTTGAIAAPHTAAAATTTKKRARGSPAAAAAAEGDHHGTAQGPSCGGEPASSSVNTNDVEDSETAAEDEGDPRDLAETLELLSRSAAPLSMPRAFHLLRGVRAGDARLLDGPHALASRSTASPLVPSPTAPTTVYVVRRGAPAAACSSGSAPSSAAEPAAPEADKDAASLNGHKSEASSSSSAGASWGGIAVSFQSVVNSDVWWLDPSDEAGEGVAARPMSRTAQRRGESRKTDHGYRGRMYTLVVKAPGAQGELPSKRRRNNDARRHKLARVVAFGDSLVHAWPQGCLPEGGPALVTGPPSATAPDHKAARPPPPPPKATASAAQTAASAVVHQEEQHRRPASAAASLTSSSSEDDASGGTATPPPPSSVTTTPAAAAARPYFPVGGECADDDEGDDDGRSEDHPHLLKQPLLVQPQSPQPTTAFKGHVVVEGDLRVDGVVYGQLSSKPRCADYAEWFAFADPDGAEKALALWAGRAGAVPAGAPIAGSVVQLRSPEQTLTLDTTGEGPCLIVSTSPSVAAGVPDGPAAKRGALVAFLGQVPVRCRGPVAVGDQLVPSGDCDGCAVSLTAYVRKQKALRRQARLRALRASTAQPCWPARRRQRGAEEDEATDDDDATAAVGGPLNDDDAAYWAWGEPEEILPDALGIAMEASTAAATTAGIVSPAGDEPPGTTKRGSSSSSSSGDAAAAGDGAVAVDAETEETLLSFVRWNHAVRRELQDEIDKVVYQMHGSMLSVLVYVTALLAAGLVALLGTLLVFDVARGAGVEDAALRRQEVRLQDAIVFLGFVVLLLGVACVAVFTTRLPNRAVLAAHALAVAVVLPLNHATWSGKSPAAALAIRVILHVVLFSYHAVVCLTALQLRKDQTRPNSLFHSCSPRAVTWMKRLAPLLCILAIFAGVFVAPSRG